MIKKNKINSVLENISQKIGKIKDQSNTIKTRNISEKKLKTENNKFILELSPLNILKNTFVVIAAFLLLFLVFRILDILILFFLAFFIAAGLNPLINYFQVKKIPRLVSVLLVYFVILALITVFISFLLPLIAQQILGLIGAINKLVGKLSTSNGLDLPFAKNFEPYLDKIYQAVDIKVIAMQIQNSLQLISSQLLNLGGNIWYILMQLTNGLFNFILMLILVFFMTFEEKVVENFIISTAPISYENYLKDKLKLIQLKIGDWIRGQFLVSLIATVISFIGLAIAGVNYALLISVITGICMVIPMFGRLVAAILIIPIVLSQSVALTIFVLIYYFIISNLENNILVPLIMNKAVGLNPLTIIFALLVGFQLFGFIGLILAVPVATILEIFLKDLIIKFKSID